MAVDLRVEQLARAMCEAAGNVAEDKVISSFRPLERVDGRGDWHKLPPLFAILSAWEIWIPDAEAALAHLAQEPFQALLDSQAMASFPRRASGL